MADYPICTNCQKHAVEHVVVPSPNGTLGRSVKVILCNKYPHPINGNPLQAEECRKDERMCGFLGKGYEQKEEAAPVVVTAK